MNSAKSELPIVTDYLNKLTLIYMNENKPAGRAEEEGWQWQVSAPLETLVDKPKECA